MLNRIESWCSLFASIFSLASLLIIIINTIFPKKVLLKKVGINGVKFRVQRKHFNVQQITNIISSCYYEGGQIPPPVRNEIIELTSARGIKKCKAKKMKEDQQVSTMFINLSNHPSSLWSPEQLDAAKEYGKIVDIPFPTIDPQKDKAYIDKLVDDYFNKVVTTAEGCPVFTVHLMGEMNFSFALLERLRNHNVICVASTTQRSSDGTNNQFKFVRFRNY